jgi:hypothetical protein
MKRCEKKMWASLKTDKGSARAFVLQSPWHEMLMLFALFMVLISSVTDKGFAQSEFPQHGFSFDCDKKRNYEGWRCNGGGLYPKKATPIGVEQSEEICCFYMLSPFTSPRARKMMLVRTDKSETIIEWMVVEWRSDDYFDDTQSCELNGMRFEVSVVNRKKKTIVGIVVDESGFKQMSLNWISFPCSIP